MGSALLGDASVLRAPFAGLAHTGIETEIGDELVGALDPADL
jgi:hypothetical protein